MNVERRAVRVGLTALVALLVAAAGSPAAAQTPWEPATAFRASDVLFYLAPSTGAGGPFGCVGLACESVTSRDRRRWRP